MPSFEHAADFESESLAAPGPPILQLEAGSNNEIIQAIHADAFTVAITKGERGGQKEAFITVAMALGENAIYSSFTADQLEKELPRLKLAIRDLRALEEEKGYNNGI